MEESIKKINEVFVNNFGRTPLKERIDDILRETIELSRYIDVPNLKEETGDLLCSVLQLCNENEWSPKELIDNTLVKINRRQLQYKTLGRKTKVAILGGAFNPPHYGHLQAAQAILSFSRNFDEVWLMPCAAHMDNKKLASAKQRLEMLKILVKQDARIRVSSYEIDNQFQGETYHLVKSISKNLAGDQYEFSMAIGLDNALTFDSWYNYEYLERMIRFIVIPRAGISFDVAKVNWFLKQPHIYLLPDKPLAEMSSTKVRNLFESSEHEYLADNGIKEQILKLIPEELFNYIITNGLYKK
jgi:nicotinate-nucleotide adenylyltransferase